ncbi:MAG TPA: hypothetical protein VGK32_24080 [Vicinamibacterales bacterium]|jgi:hypothetical protein
MDLRPFITTTEQLERGLEFIRHGELFYQPFILADEIEVGEGHNFCKGYAGATRPGDFSIHAKGIDIGPYQPPADVGFFRECNAEYRRLYDHIADAICRHAGDRLGQFSIAEVGCNTGLNLFNLAVRGAGSCCGYDWNDMTRIFGWLNSLLGTNVRFQTAIYDSLSHHLAKGVVLPEVDIIINAMFLQHQCDPLQALCFLCDRARHGIFLWVETGLETADQAVLYPSTPYLAYFDTGLAFPLNFNQEVRISEPMLLRALRDLGFEDVDVFERFLPGLSPRWEQFQRTFRMYYATRTHRRKSAYWRASTAA